MLSSRSFIVRILVASCLLFAAGVERLPAGDESKWTVDDVVLAETGGSFQISPDARWAVWVKVNMDSTAGTYVSNLWLSSLTDDEQIQLTRGAATHTRPRWSLDGKLITFLSTRPLPAEAAGQSAAKPDTTQLWAMNFRGGEPWPLTTLERGVKSYEWRSEDTIVIAAEEAPTLHEKKVQKRKDTSRVVEDEVHTPPVRLFQLIVEDGRIERLTHNTDWIDLLSVSPDGRWAVTRHQRSLSYEYDNRVLPVTKLTNLETLEQRTIFEGTRIIPQAVEWSLDSSGFYAVSPHTTHPKYIMAFIGLLYHYDVAGPQPPAGGPRLERRSRARI